MSAEAARNAIEAVLPAWDAARREETRRELRAVRNPVRVDVSAIDDADALALALRRLAVGLSPQELETRSARAARVVHHRDIAAYLDGTRTPDLAHLSRLLRTLGVQPTEEWLAALDRATAPAPTPPPTGHSVFLCHSSGDKERVRALYRVDLFRDGNYERLVAVLRG